MFVVTDVPVSFKHAVFHTFSLSLQRKRQEIFTAIIRNRHMVSHQTLEQLDLNVILGRTEGYVAQDLENLVSRAIHAHTIMQGRDALTIYSFFKVTKYNIFLSNQLQIF